uniref:EF-hand domain-containing protein n=1 Tax=Salix viminalis TaxID=40686 RepID=A0A6N2MSG0_SALVM
MTKRDFSGSEADESENSSSEEGEEVGGKLKGITEYEKQRLSRIAENKARMEALGLNKMATSLMGSVQKSRQRKGKQKFVDDEEYKPNDETACDDDDDDDDFDDEDFVGGQSSSKSRRSKAIALSLRDSPNNATPKERKVDAHVQEDAGRRKRKKSQLSSRVQMTEDDLILHFFQFDEAGKGAITKRDLRRVANAHDFTWTDKELADMIHCFDGDGDGKLTLDDFRKIAGRCNMTQGSENQ